MAATAPGATTVDIERFVEAHRKVRVDRYPDPEPDVLGVTEFAPGERPRVRIGRDPTGSR